MTYIPKRKTLHIRHEDVVKGDYTYFNGRWWFGTDSDFTAYGLTVGISQASANLTGTRYEESDIELTTNTNQNPYTWGLPAGTYSLEYKNLLELNDTANPADYKVQVQNGNNDTTNYSPQFTRNAYYPNANDNYMTWIDIVENNINYRQYNVSKKFTSTGYDNWNANGNLRFQNRYYINSTKLERIHYEDIKIVKLD